MTQVEIYNLALVRIKEPTVQATDEATHQAETLTVLWPTLIEKMLRRHHWHFARRNVQLAEHADDPPEGWTFRYALPTDLVRVRRTYVEQVTGSSLNFDMPTTSQALPYTLQPDNAATSMTMLSMFDDLFLEYTFRTVAPLLWPVDFCDALAWHLAMESVVNLTGRADLVEYCQKGYVAAMSAAITHNANSIQNGPVAAAESIKARW